MTITVNSKTCEISEPGASMLAFLRSDLGLTAVKLGCGRMRAAGEGDRQLRVATAQAAWATWRTCLNL